jgi:TolB-like protein/Tfp pilus assembly protein PilF
MSLDKDQEWFSDGISEEIINSLANLKGLKVMARTSSFYFKGKDVPFADIATQLDVDYLVEGSVRRVDDQLRITVQLIAKDGFHVFSETYDRPARDLLKVQNDIAFTIAAKLLKDLNPRLLSGVIPDKSNSVEAFEFYLRGKALKGWEASPTNEELFWKTISLDPDFAPTYGLLADIYDTKGNAPVNRKKAWRMRDSLSQVGYRLNPTSPEVLYARFLTFFKSQSPDADSALYFLKKAYALHPENAFVNYFIGAFYVRLGMDEQARDFLNKSIGLDPLNLVPRRWLGQHQLLIGDLPAAEQSFRKMIELDSLISFDHRELARVYVMRGELTSAANELEKAEKMDGIRNSRQKAMLLAAVGKREEALKFRNINVLGLLKMKREILERLDSLTSDPTVNASAHMASLEKNPIFDFVRDEPEFKLIYARMKLVHEENMKRFGKLD